MSVSHEAGAVIGYRVPAEFFFNGKETAVRGCDHAIEETHKFCSECGKPAVVTLHPDMDEVREHTLSENKWKGFDVFPVANDVEPEYFIVGRGVSADEREGYHALLQSQNIENFEEIQRELDERGLGCYSVFGLWVALIVSV